MILPPVHSPGRTLPLSFGRFVLLFRSFALGTHVVTKCKPVEERVLSSVYGFSCVHPIRGHEVEYLLWNIQPKSAGFAPPGGGFNIYSIDDLLVPGTANENPKIMSFISYLPYFEEPLI